MTDRLTEIRERYEAITPGPWDWFGNTATEQVFLGTPDRGRLFIMAPSLRAVEYVFDNNEAEGYELEEARKRIHSKWCPAHAEHVDPNDTGECMCDEIREFMSGSLDPMEDRNFDHAERGYRVSLTRSVQTFPDLRFYFDGRTYSYRESGPRYEVLGYRTRAQWESAHDPRVAKVEDALYREDFRGIHNPNADFIAHSPEDIGYLTKRVELAERALASMQNYATWAMRGQALQGTADAQAQAARDLLAWEMHADPPPRHTT